MFIFQFQKNIKYCNNLISVQQKKFYDCSLLNNLLFMIIKFIVIKFKLGCKILIAYFRWNIITKVLLVKKLLSWMELLNHINVINFICFIKHSNLNWTSSKVEKQINGSYLFVLFFVTTHFLNLNLKVLCY